MRYRIYAHLGPVPNFENQDVLVSELNIFNDHNLCVAYLAKGVMG